MKKKATCIAFVFLVFCIASTICACKTLEKEAGDADIAGNGANANESVVYSLGVMGDMQIQPSDSMDSVNGIAYKELSDYNSYHSINAYSEAIFKNSVDEYIAIGVKNVIMVGDISNDGDTRSFDVLKDGCEKFRRAGINVYITLGICDLFGIPSNFMGEKSYEIEPWNPQNFATDFYGYMGAEPYSTDENSYSYAVDIPNSNITLVSLDTASSFSSSDTTKSFVHYFRHDKTDFEATQTTSDALIAWFKNALSDAEIRNRAIYVTTYFPLDENMTSFYGESANNDFIYCDKRAEIKSLCTSYGVKAVFSGHLHTEAQKTYTDENGSTELFVLGSLSTYPLPIHVYKYYEDGSTELSTKQLNGIRAEYLPAYTTEEDRIALTQNALEYAKTIIKKAFVNKWKTAVLGSKFGSNYPYMRSFLVKLGLFYYNSKPCDTFINEGNEWLETDVNYLPLYGEGESVESICASHGVTLPKSQYTTVLDFMGEMVCTMYDGTFDMSPGSINSQILRYSMYAGVEILADMDPLSLLNDINSNVITCSYDDMLDKLFKYNIIDLKSNDLIRSLMSIIANAVNKKLGRDVIKVNTSDEIMEGLALLLPSVILPVLNMVSPNAYDSENDTVWLIEYKKVLIMPEGYLDCNYFIDVMGPQLISSNARFKI